MVGQKVYRKGFTDERQLTNAMDKDDSGFLDRFETRDFFSTYLGLRNNHADHFFDLLDDNGDGKIYVPDIRRCLAPYFQKTFREPRDLIPAWQETGGAAKQAPASPSQPSHAAGFVIRPKPSAPLASTMAAGQSRRTSENGDAESANGFSQVPSQRRLGTGQPPAFAPQSGTRPNGFLFGGEAGRGREPQDRRSPGGAQAGPPQEAPQQSLDLSGFLLNEVRKQAHERGGSNNVQSLDRTFKRAEAEGNRSMALRELEKGLVHCGLRLGRKDMDLLLLALDR